MKKTMIAIALLASMLMLASCDTPGNSPAASAPDSAAEQTTETAESTDIAETTTESAAETVTELTATETESETESTTTEMCGAPDNDFTSIAGVWYIDGDPTTASIKISADGTFKSYYASGNLENEGTICREGEEVEGTTNYWYNLYDKNGEYIMGFLDTGSSTDLYVGNGATPHFRKFGEGGLADDGRGPGEEFVGKWNCDRAYLTITQISDTEFHALVKWGSSASSHVEWDYPLTYQGGKLVCSGKASKTYVEYASADAEPDKTVEYTDGSGKFVMQGADVVWNDLTEHSGDDMVFRIVTEE